MLGVHRHDGGPPFGGATEDEAAGHNERFLVGQREGGPGVEGRQRRQEAGRPGDAVHHDVRAAVPDGRQERLHAAVGEHGAGGGKFGGQPFKAGGAGVG